MAPTLNQEDIKLLKGIFATKDDLKNEIKMSEKRIIKRVDEMDIFLDREHMKLVREVDDLKLRLPLSISN
ncbi:MAG: hypothetical protein Q8L51_02515 [Candidatus Amesbacteria bacterium]|nr:hypothetical protein [Candidatus Amesbacteria bacterium]